jgi:hypothetical protein
VDDGAEPTAGSPVPVSLLADLQAGLLDDDTAAALRRRIRTDPEAAHTASALDRVRRDLADLGSDSSAALELPDVPADVTTRLAAALTSATTVAPHTATRGPAAHATRDAAIGPRAIAMMIGGIAALGAFAIGVAALVDDEPQARSTAVTAERITVSRSPAAFPVRETELLALLDRPADLGALTDPVRLRACLTAAGLPDSVSVLGADTVDVDGRPAVVLVVAGDVAGVRNDTLTAIAVAPTCSADAPGLLAHTVLPQAPATP